MEEGLPIRRISASEEENKQIFPIEKYEGPSKSQLLDFVLEHMLGLDELLLPCFHFWDTRKKNIEIIENGGYQGALVTRLTDSIKEPHYILPSGSNFEGLNLPHLNYKEIRRRSVSNLEAGEDEEHAWVSDIDLMCVLTNFSISENTRSASDEGIIFLEAAGTPGYVMLRLNKRGLVPWKEVIHEHSGSTFISSKKFIQIMNKKAEDFCSESQEDHITSITFHGPALQITKQLPSVEQNESIDGKSKQFLKNMVPGEDIVWALQFPGWPMQARAWSVRERVFPDQEVVESIVQSGCHIVPVASKLCKPLLEDLEWRLSFSSAEKTIAKLLTVLQRKVYLITKALHYTHLKKFGVISTYFLKTALFWHCEGTETAAVWQTGNIGQCFFSFVDILARFLENANWPHYFIADNNLIGHIQSENIRQVLDVVKRIQLEPLIYLQKCQNLLVSSFLEETENSFDITFGPLLREIQTADAIIQPSAFFDCLWDLGNYYLLNAGFEPALHYYKLAAAYSRDIDVDQHLNVITTIKDYAFMSENLDDAIAYTEELVSMMKSKPADESYKSITLYSESQKELNSHQENAYELGAGNEGQQKWYRSETDLKTNRGTEVILGRSFERYKETIDEKGLKSVTNQGTEDLVKTVLKGQQDEEEVPGPDFERHQDSEFALGKAFERQKEKFGQPELELNKSREIRAELENAKKQLEEGSQSEKYFQTNLGKSDKLEKDFEGEMEIGDKCSDENSQGIEKRREPQPHSVGQISVGEASCSNAYHVVDLTYENATQEVEKGCYQETDMVSQPLDEDRTPDVAISNLACMFHIRGEQQQSEKEKKYWKQKAEATFKEAIVIACSLDPFIQYGNFLLHENRPDLAKSVLSRAIEQFKAREEISYIYFQDIEKCTLDPGVVYMLETEGRFAFNSVLYCRYLLIKCCLALSETRSLSVLIKGFEDDVSNVENDDIGKRGALSLLKQAFLSCGLDEKADEVQSRIEIYLEDGSMEEEAKSKDDEIGEIVEIDVSGTSYLAAFHLSDK